MKGCVLSWIKQSPFVACGKKEEEEEGWKFSDKKGSQEGFMAI